MEFTLGRPLRVPIKIRQVIDGKETDVEYRFAKYLGDAFEAKVEAYTKKVMDSGLSQYEKNDRDGRARFCAMFQVKPVDVLQVEADLKTPAGCNEVIRWCGEHAEPVVPPEILDQLIAETPVPFKRQLVDVLIGTLVYRDAMEKDSGEPERPEDTASPLTSSDGPSGPSQQG